jgi:hypothetical protein
MLVPTADANHTKTQSPIAMLSRTLSYGGQSLARVLVVVVAIGVQRIVRIKE